MIYVPGLTVGQLSGTAGNTVARANPFATTIGVARPRRLPLTPYNQAQRASFSAISQLYATLDSGQVADWQALGESINRTGRLSREFTLSARTAFFQINRNLNAIGEAYVVDAPALSVPDAPFNLSGAAVAQPTGPYDLEFSWEPDPVDSGSAVIVQAHAPVSAQLQNFPESGWKQLQVEAAASSSPHDVTAAYQSRFGNWFVGQVIPLRAVIVSLDGFASLPASVFVTST